MDWLVELSAAMGSVQRTAPLIATLATVDWQGRPRARSVVCRRVADDGAIWIASDARSEKNVHVRESKMAELVIWLPQPREQFRLFCDVSVLGMDSTDPQRQQFWQQLTSATRAMFTWPTPGSPLDPDPVVFPLELNADSPISEHFELLMLRPEVVERLQLQPQPHRRTRWRREAGWRAEPLNP